VPSFRTYITDRINFQGIPDVAAQADRFRIFLSGKAVSIGGTSAATPTFAGIVSLLNSARLSKGLPSLGFINPLIYSANVSETFSDITIGSNPGCGTEGFNVGGSLDFAATYLISSLGHRWMGPNHGLRDT
jgi:subtilase family serine protease